MFAFIYIIQEERIDEYNQTGLLVLLWDGSLGL